MTNLADILNRPASEFNFPPPLPEGGYLCVVAGFPEEVTAESGTPGFRFALKPTAILDDVNEKELADVGGLDGKTIYHTFWISQDPKKTPTSMAFLREFLEKCGINYENKSIAAMLDEVRNCEVIAYMTHEPIRGRDGFRAVVAKFGPAED